MHMGIYQNNDFHRERHSNLAQSLLSFLNICLAGVWAFIWSLSIAAVLPELLGLDSVQRYMRPLTRYLVIGSSHSTQTPVHTCSYLLLHLCNGRRDIITGLYQMTFMDGLQNERGGSERSIFCGRGWFHSFYFPPFHFNHTCLSVWTTVHCFWMGIKNTLNNSNCWNGLKYFNNMQIWPVIDPSTK